MPIVRYCCCGCSLKTGTLIIFGKGMVIAALGIVNTLLVLIATGRIRIISTMIVLIMLIILFLGIYGALMEKPGYLIPFLVAGVLYMVWIIIVMFAIAFLSAVFLPLILAMFHWEDYQSVIVSGITFFEISLLFILVLSFYYFIVVLSFYQELKAETEETSAEQGVPALT